jgi:hypothetical protein
MPTTEPQFAVGEIAYTQWGKPVAIEGIEILTHIMYRAGGEYWQEDELRKGAEQTCTHTDQNKPASNYGTSNPPDEMDWNFAFCPLCGENLTQTVQEIEINWTGGK